LLLAFNPPSAYDDDVTYNIHGRAFDNRNGPVKTLAIATSSHPLIGFSTQNPGRRAPKPELHQLVEATFGEIS